MVSRDEVVKAFRVILEREPESNKIIDEHRKIETLPLLCDTLLNSVEYKAKLAHKSRLIKSFPVDVIDDVAKAFEQNDSTTWNDMVLAPPDWAEAAMEPDGEVYRDAVMRHWREITGRDSYSVDVNEDTPEISSAEALRRPGFYGSSDTKFAGGQMMAIGHILMRSGIGPGGRVLEYGAGMGQTALAFARLGVCVDTVDINPHYCRVVNEIGKHYDFKLHGHVGRFGNNPAGVDHAYDLVYFYEAFHHCIDFLDLIPRLRELLKPGGRVILAGEPIFEAKCPEMPYPWGFRLDWENIAVMRIRGWMELGFQKDFLLGRFADAGFDCHEHRDPNSHWAQIYEFRLREI